MGDVIRFRPRLRKEAIASASWVHFCPVAFNGIGCLTYLDKRKKPVCQRCGASYQPPIGGPAA